MPVASHFLIGLRSVAVRKLIRPNGCTRVWSSQSQQDQIFLRGLLFHGYHGVLPEENVLGQKFIVDLVLSADLQLAGQSDNLENTVNYAEVYKSVKGVVEGPHHQLIESVAESIASETRLVYKFGEGDDQSETLWVIIIRCKEVQITY
ncbi:hypothetical protein CYMTET_16452 [Cymbomonas tetramitiformis]|uniref:7,8-dihydroneopterin aldolase n=1 Tax=Cymbomonas tetramitiformis TaxID=36881 RepID=A0AAE0L804_9CHLO|nr:hypothetical protein CYMTET_16452 [Cymbomonas tetramitiformis]